MRVLPANLSIRKALGRLPARLYVVALGLIVALLATYFLVVRPRNEAMAAARDGIRDQRADLQVLEVEMTRLETARHQADQLRKAIDAFEGRLPRQGEIDVILREVWVIADAAGLKTQRIRTQKDQPLGSYKVLPIELNLRGRFEGLYGFLTSLERLPGIMKVQSLKMTSTVGEENGCVDASLVLSVYCKE